MNLLYALVLMILSAIAGYRMTGQFLVAMLFVLCLSAVYFMIMGAKDEIINTIKSQNSSGVLAQKDKATRKEEKQ